MKIYSLEESMLERLKSLMTSYQFLPYQEYEIGQSRLVNNVVGEISDLLSSGENIILVAEQLGKLVGLVTCEKLSWDTRHFGIEMAKIRYLIVNADYSNTFEVKSALLSYLLMKCSKKFHHLSIRVHTEDVSSIHSLENAGFRLMDTTVTYSFDFRKDQIVRLENECYVRKFRKNEIDKLANIATECYEEGRVATDRFHADPSLPSEKSDDLYVKWIVNSCKGLADTVLVAEVDGVPVGFITCKVYRQLSEKLGVRLGTMVISGVSPSCRGRGAYTSMFNTGLRWLAERVNIVEVGTQISNYVVQKVWNRLGFKLIRSQYTLHRFIDR